MTPRRYDPIDGVWVNVPRPPEEYHDIRQARPDNPVALANGSRTTDPRLDRVREFDQRSRQFGLQAAFNYRDYKPRSYTWDVDAHLDQGNEGSCVGFAWAHELLSRPAVIPADYDYARWIYKTAQRYDPWSGEAYEGTSVLAGAKVLQQQPPKMNEGRGFMDEYRWIFGNMDELIITLGYFGPVVFGLDWYSDMFDTDTEGFIHVGGYVAGGHAILGKGVNLNEQAVRLQNSWGEGWGEGGDAWLSFADLQRLLDDGGEVCVPVRRRRLK